jgi:hypothetical protein
MKKPTSNPATLRRGHPPDAMRPLVGEAELQVRSGYAAAAFLAMSVFYFLPAFLPGRGIFGTDYLAATYIFHEFIGQRFAAGELPKWVPYVFGGLPLFANPGSAFHPVHIIGDLFLPTGRVLAFVFVVQTWFGGVGMFLLARELRCRPWIAFLAGLAFQFTGITLSWVYAGHDGRMMVATMAPLFLFFIHRGVRSASLAPFAGAAAALALALLSFQIQNAYYLLLAGAVWGVFCIWNMRDGRTPVVHGRLLAMGLGSVAMAFLIAAVNFLPFLGFVPESPRGDPEGRGYEYSVSFSMPPSDLISLAVPEQSGATVYEIDRWTGNPVRPLFPEYDGPNPMKLHTEYVGALVVLLLGLGVIYARRDRHWLFFAGLALFFITMALGGHTPIYRLYYEVLPGLKRFRAPDLAFYVVAVSLVAMAALTLERIARLRESAATTWPPRGEATAPLRPLGWVVLGVFCAVLLGGLAAGAAGAPASGEPARAAGWWRFALFVGATGGLLWAWAAHRVTSLALALALAVITTADLWIVGQRFFQTAPPATTIFAPDDVAAWLARQPEPARVWNFPGAPHRGRDDSYLMHFGVHQAGGEHSTPLQRWNEYVGAGEGLMPRSWANFLQQQQFLNAANVRYLLFAAELDEPWLRQVYRGTTAIVYENIGALPRAYLVPEAVTIADGQALPAMQTPGWDPRRTAFVTSPQPLALPAGPMQGDAQIVKYESDRVVVQASTDRAALLVLADNMYPGWTATLNGESVEVLRTNHTFRGVVVPRGEHVVEFSFRPRELYLGFYLYLAGWTLLLAYAAVYVVRKRSRATTALQPV